MTVTIKTTPPSILHNAEYGIREYRAAWVMLSWGNEHEYFEINLN